MLTLFSHLRLGLPSDLHHFPPNTRTHFFLSPMKDTSTRQSQSASGQPNNICQDDKVINLSSFSFFSFLHLHPLPIEIRKICYITVNRIINIQVACVLVLFQIILKWRYSNFCWYFVGFSIWLEYKSILFVRKWHYL
jgi:hypothetical protein